MQADDERRTHTQIVFRSANEAISRNAAARSDPRTFLCECSDEGCMLLLELTVREYEQVRAEPHGFVLAEGHEENADRVVHRFDRFTLIRKTGAAATLARALDPRRGE